jgi:hypothetical protein
MVQIETMSMIIDEGYSDLFNLEINFKLGCLKSDIHNDFSGR